jgi:hypothetical protein
VVRQHAATTRGWEGDKGQKKTTIARYPPSFLVLALWSWITASLRNHTRAVRRHIASPGPMHLESVPHHFHYHPRNRNILFIIINSFFFFAHLGYSDITYSPGALASLPWSTFPRVRDFFIQRRPPPSLHLVDNLRHERMSRFDLSSHQQQQQ